MSYRSFFKKTKIVKYIFGSTSSIDILLNKASRSTFWSTMHKVNRVLLDYVKAHKWSTLFFVTFGLFWAFTLPYMSYLFGDIVERIKMHGIDNVSVYELVLTPLCLYVSIHVLRSIGYYTHGLFGLISIPAYKSHLVNRLFNQLSRQSVHYFEEKRAGFLSNKITNVCISIEPIIYNLSAIIIPQSLAILLTGVMLSLVVPYFGAVLWVWGVGIIFYTYRAAKKGQVKAAAFAAACSVFNGHVVDVMTNISSIIHNVVFQQESDLLLKNMDGMIDKERQRNRHANRVMLIQFLAMNGIVAFFLVGSIIGYQQHLVTLGEMVFVMTAVTSIAGLTSSLGNNFLELIYHIGLLNEGLSLLEEEPDVPESPHATVHNISHGEICIKNMTFAYPTQPFVFNKLNLTISPKEKIGIVGESGAGKTTLVKLLMRLYDVVEGEILIDDINVKDYTKKSLRSQIALVPQQLGLFHRSIAENITYGCGEVTQERVRQAAKKANAHDFIDVLDKGYETVIGEQGAKLSGGQRQRILIARAILKNAPILLLDEATSALDSVTEKAIQAALETLLKDKTAIIVAHRLSTLKMMDRIIVFEKGMIVESGTHEALIKKKGSYYQYWQHQSEGFIEH